MEYVAFDFETANPLRYSACALGAVKVREGWIVGSFYTLIDPETYFAPRNIAVHGIHPTDVVQAPKYPEVIQAFSDFCQGLPVASHSQFDRGVVQAANARYQLPRKLGLDYFDSCQLARILWRGRVRRFGLKSLCDQINFQFTHHNALEDARAAAHVIEALKKTSQVESVKGLVQAAGIPAFYAL